MAELGFGGGDPLSCQRKFILEQNKKELQKNIKLGASLLVDLLLENGMLNSQDNEEIQVDLDFIC